MHIYRTIAASVVLGLLTTAALAEEPDRDSRPAAAVGVKLPACSQSMIAGSWQGLFANPYLGYTLACALTVSSTGTISNSTCKIGNFTHGGWTLTLPPSGNLTINRACHVIGTINYTVCSGPPCGNLGASINVQALPSLWRSPDGGRLSGFVEWTSPDGGSQFYAVDLIAGQ